MVADVPPHVLCPRRVSRGVEHVIAIREALHDRRAVVVVREGPAVLDGVRVDVDQSPEVVVTCHPAHPAIASLVRQRDLRTFQEIKKIQKYKNEEIKIKNKK